MDQSIAVIGMSCKASGIDNLDDYWQVISQGKKSVKRYTSEELLHSGVDAKELGSADYIPVGGEISDADVFDADFFGIPPKEALYTDPQHRKFLEVVYHAFEHAGIVPEAYDGFAGVFAGCSQNNYRLQNIEKTRASQEWSEFQKQIASDKDFLATQVAYKLGLRGPALTVQTACSTSLVAIDTACKYLASGQCDIAVAGGAYINVPLKQGYRAVEGGILSPSGECRAFDSRADGTIFSAGVGAVILKPLEQAIEDGDTIYGVIESIATNNDGNKKVSYTAPGYDGQAEVITIAQAMADIDPQDISYIEAHGTGTKLGDPLEIQALTNAFRLGTSEKQFCTIGSVKPNIGHCDAAAGVMGFIKVCLCLSHRFLPPQINFDQVNPEIDIENSPFTINKTGKPWPVGKNGKRIAAVSSFGVGGTNAHAILSEPPKTKARSSKQPSEPLIIPVTGKCSESVVETAHKLGEYLQANSVDLSCVAHTMIHSRASFDFRDYVVAATTEEASEKLLALNSRSPAKVKSANAPVIFMFPGQGSQHVDMGRDLYEKEPVFRESMDKCFDILDGILEYGLKQVLYPDAEDRDAAAEFLKHTEVAQPALFSVSYSMAGLLHSRGIRADKMVGHSIGEYVAACLSGVLTLEDALKIVAKRGQLMQAMDAGSMLAVIADSSTVASELPDDLSIAAINSPSITVVSGESSAIEKFEKHLSEQSVRTVPLHTSHAFHSYMMEPMLKPFIKAFKQVKLHSPSIPFISCVSGEVITEEQCQSPQYWADQVRSPVLFSAGITNLVDGNKAVCLEVGPSNALTSALSAHEFANDVLNYNTMPPAAKPENAADQFQATLGNLWKSAGLVDLQQLTAKDIGYHIPLPGYAFKQDRYWIDYVIQNSPVASQHPQQSQHSEQTNTIEQSSVEDELKVILFDLSGIQFNEGNYESDFISLGFESLLAADICSSLKAKIGVEVDIASFLSSYNSFSKLLAHCVSERGEYIAKEQPRQEAQESFESSVADDQLFVPASVQGVSLADVYFAIQEQTRLLKQLLEQQVSGASTGENPHKTTLNVPDQTIVNFMPKPCPEARLGRDPKGYPHWYVPDPQKPGQYRIVRQVTR